MNQPTDASRPAIATDEHLLYLDEICGGNGKRVAVIFAAYGLLRRQFPQLTVDESHDIVDFWVLSYEERRGAHRVDRSPAVQKKAQS